MQRKCGSAMCYSPERQSGGMMFLEEPVCAKIVSVFCLEWDFDNKVITERPNYVLSFRAEGSSVLSTPDGDIELHSNDMALFPKNYSYRHISRHEKIYAVHFAADQPVAEQIATFTPTRPGYFADRFAELYKTWNEKKIGYEYRCSILFYKILLEIELQKSESQVNKLEKAMEYLHENFDSQDISVEKLASICHVSSTFFRRLFKEQLGTTPLEYINNLRLIKAKELLESGYYTVEEVSDRCGFHNTNYFSLFFKRRAGCAPSVYKKSFK